MFRRYPYWGWLLLCVLLWSITGYYFYTHTQETTPVRMTAAVNSDMHNREAAFDKLISDEALVSRMFSDSLSLQEVKRISDMPFYVFAYEHNYLKFWNTNAIIPLRSDTGNGRPVLLTNDRGVFVQKSIKAPRGARQLVVMFPVLITYPVENDHLRSHFVASAHIPATTRVLPVNGRPGGSFPVTMNDGKTLFYLVYNIQDIQKWSPGPVFIALLALAVLLSISWVHLIIIYLMRNRSSLVGFFSTLAVIVALRTYLYMAGPPFHLDTLLFFSPLLYASSSALPSFGDLFINTLCILWLVVFITRHTPYKTYFAHIRSARLRMLLPAPLAMAMVGYMLLFVAIIRGLILDSSISFDVSRFYSINIYTILGLTVICTITGISCMIINVFNFQLRTLVPDRMRRYGVVLFMGILVLFISGYYTDVLYWCLLGWLTLFLALLDTPRLKLVSDLFEPQMLIWALFIGAFCTGLVQYFNIYKENEERKAFVEQRLAPHRDNLLEYTFDRTADAISKDAQLKQFFYRPSANDRRVVNKHLDTLYRNTTTARYDANIYIFDVHGVPLYNRDSLSLASLQRQRNEATPTGSPYLFYKESMPDKNAYLSFIPIYSDTINNKIGYVMIDMSLKKQAASTVYPELLLPSASKNTPQENEYSYAVYVNGRLVSQETDRAFPTFLSGDTIAGQDYRFRSEGNVSELRYRVSDKRTIVVVHDNKQFIETITVFFYIFCIQVALAVIILLYQIYLSYFASSTVTERYVRLDLRKRIQYSMLGIVFFSFLLVGVVTVWYFSNRYRDEGTARLQSAMHAARQSVQGYLNAARAYETDERFDSVTQSVSFRKFISVLADNQKIDINLFDNNGNLFATSEEEIYQKGLVSRIIRQDAYYQLNTSGTSIVIQNENVAELSYLSAYEPMLDEQGVALGYLNVPFFSSEKELRSQLSGIAITLMNVFAFIFLVSSLITVYITRWVTGSFNVIKEQFGRLNLQRNERIEWPYDDEIGSLVKEYNKMVDKVEENAALLAQSERETAWREMARQVAHEIKNPLTPMKLNIQYLQQAVRNDAPNLKELLQRVSASIIEQIDNLSYIASEFSNFAKMPEARPEELDLGDLLQLAVGLYRNDGQAEVELSIPSEKVFVHSDHSQVLRMLTNLLENAKQAIPEDRQGKIVVTLNTDDSKVTISVADNGRGISADVAARIFQPYFTTRSSGTGLGLAMTKKMIEFWKGAIWFESEEGQGTTFYLMLPRSAGNA
ncbi:HAMP domain-containing sensor histidine kinase [Nemorincola caseinilytica]|uniref:histidine kinase n=1 Tax=Nemorincola caseinilytica TaxID=2054315 RepID=A0ABP8NEZ5_9BACT